MTISHQALLERNAHLMEGVKKYYEESDGDMWFFELYHHLNDFAAALKERAPERNPKAEL